MIQLVWCGGGVMELLCSLDAGTGQGQEPKLLFRTSEGRSALGEDVQGRCSHCLYYPAAAQVTAERSMEKEELTRRVDKAGFL